MPYKDPEKQKEAQRRHYQENKDRYGQSAKVRKRTMYEKIQSIKESSPCADCNTFYPYWIMQFDHVDDNKVLAVAHLARTKGWPTVKAEIDKCELVCANCHATRTHSRLRIP